MMITILAGDDGSRSHCRIHRTFAVDLHSNHCHSRTAQRFCSNLHNVGGSSDNNDGGGGGRGVTVVIFLKMKTFLMFMMMAVLTMVIMIRMVITTTMLRWNS